MDHRPVSRSERVSGRLAMRAGSRPRRRSFLGHEGRVGLVVAGAGLGVNAIADSAWALTCDCGGPNCNAGCGPGRGCPGCDVCSHSVTCGTGGNCPGDTVACGSWVCSCSSCGSGFKRWADCCAANMQCNQSSDCRCVNDKDGVTRPSCCYKKCYSGGGSNCNHYIECRVGGCT